MHKVATRSLAERVFAVAVAASITGASGIVAVDAAHGASGAVAASSVLVPHLPTVVNAPGTWSDREVVHGPVAAVGIAMRARPDGLFGARKDLAVFAVSALDGSASWLGLPGFSLERWGFIGGVAVSPDGRWIGWVRPMRPTRRGDVRVAGWSVMNTATGAVRRLDVAGFPWVRGTAADLAFSGDSRYLLTSYEPPDRSHAARSRGHQLVAWDVRTGAPTVAERPGHYWLPNLGSAPSVMTWARGRTVFRLDPATGERRSVRLPEDVVAASWGPDDSSFAYIGRTSLSSGRWRLHVGRTLAAAARRVVDLPPGVEPGEVLGWRDSAHVVIGHFRRTVQVVDVDTGAVESLDMAGYGDQVNAPSLAAALWAQPLAAPVGPRATVDPRRPWRRAGGLAAVAAGLGALVGLLRRRRRRQPVP